MPAFGQEHRWRMNSRGMHRLPLGAFVALIVLSHVWAAVAQQTTKTTTRDYAIGPDDLLLVTVFDEPQLTGQFRVDSEGALSFPLLGRVPVRGLTPRAVEERLIQLLAAGFLNNPQLSVQIEQYRSQSVFIVGEVRTPAKYSLGANLSLIEALALAG